MKKRTSNIILIVKGNHNYKENGVKVSSKQAIAKYMAETCGMEEQDYGDKRIMSIIQSVVLDYIKTADEPQRLLFDYFEAAQMYDQLESWLSALRLIQVRDRELGRSDFVYVNGFNENNIDVISENTGEKMFVGE